MIKFYKIFILGFVLCISSLVNLWGDLSTGLIAWYPFDGNASDMSGSENHGTVYGASLGTDRHGQPNKAYIFDGVDDYISSNQNLSISGNQARSLTTWWKPSSIPNNKYFAIVSTGNGAGVDSGGFEILGYVRPTAHWFGLNNNIGNGVLTLGNWHCIVATYDQSKVDLYLDGSFLVSKAAVLNTTINKLFVSKPTVTGHGYAHGSIDDIRIYNRALTENEVRSLYTLENTPVPSVGIQLWLDGKDLNGDGNLSNELAVGTKLPAWIDKSGNDRDAEQNATVDQPIVSSGGGLLFDGVYDHLTLGSKYIFSDQDGMTILAVAKATANKGTNCLYSFGLTGNKTIDFSFSTNRLIGVSSMDYGGRGSYYVSSGMSIQDRSVVVFKVKFEDRQLLRLNGQTKAEEIISLSKLNATTISAHPTRGLNHGPVIIGGQSKRYFETDRFYQGSIEEILVYDRALTQAELSQSEQYLAQKWGVTLLTEEPFDPGKGLVTHWKLDGSDAGVNRVGVSPGLDRHLNPSGATFFPGNARVIKHPYNSFPTDAFTISYWERATSPRAGVRVSYATAVHENSVFLSDDALYLHGGSALEFQIVQDYFSDPYRWKQVTIGWRKSDGMTNIYWDGKLVKEGTYRQGLVTPSLGALCLGQDQDGVNSNSVASSFNQGFVGFLDDFRLYDRVLSPTEVENLYDLEKPTDGQKMKVLVRGNNRFGELGLNKEIIQKTPKTITTGVKAVASGIYHTLVLKEDGSLWTTGRNHEGELGDGKILSRSNLEMIVPSGVKQIAACGYHSLFVKSDGSLWSFGNCNHGELGLGDLTDRPSPLRVLPSGVKSVYSGVHHTLFIKSDGSLWGMGNNVHRQLGTGNSSLQLVPLQIESGEVISATGGYKHSAFVKVDGSLWTMGQNEYGQLGDGTTTSRSIPVQIETSGVVEVSAGMYHTFYRKTDGSLWTVGYNGRGQLGDGTTTNRTTPVQIEASGVVSLADSSYSYVTGYGKSDGSAWAIGDNHYGQLGDGTTIDRNQSVQIVSSGVQTVSNGHHFGYILLDTGELKGFGNRSFGRLGDGLPLAHDWTQVDIADGVRDFEMGALMSSFIKRDGQVLNVGHNANGGLGNGTKEITGKFVHLPNTNASKVAVSHYHSIYLDINGSLWGTGRNGWGELGLGDNIDRNMSVMIEPSGVKDVSVGANHTIFIKNNGSLWAMGANYNGQLGDGTRNNRNQPVQIESSGVVAITTGTWGSYYLKSDGSLWSMGYNEHGQLGIGSTTGTGVKIPTEVVNSGVVSLAAGGYNTFFTKDDGSLWGMGNWEPIGKTGQRAFPIKLHDFGVVSASIGRYHSSMITSDGSMWVMGSHGLGQWGFTNYFMKVDVFPVIKTDSNTRDTAHAVLVPANLPPQRLELTGGKIFENGNAGASVGHVVADDFDQGSNFTYSLVTGTGATHNDWFSIDANGSLIAQQSLNREANATLSIRVQVMDEANRTLEKTFLIEVLNDPAEDLILPSSEQGLVAHWRFDEKNGSVAYDSSGNGYHAHLRGAGDEAWVRQGKVNGAIQLDGLDDYLAIQGLHYSKPGEIQEITISCWIKTIQANTEGIIFSFDRSEFFRLSTGIAETNQWNRPYFSGCYNQIGLSSIGTEGTLATGNWVSLSATRNGETGENKIYLNGQIDFSETKGVGRGFGSDIVRYGFIGNGSEADKFDGLQNGTGNKYSGLIDDLRLYHRTLSDAEVASLYSSAVTDTDADGLSDLEESNLGTFANRADSDGDGLLDGEEVRGFHSYDYREGNFTWLEARLDAESRGGQLATITSAEENARAHAALPESVNAWLGGLDADLDGNFTWITDEVWGYEGRDANLSNRVRHHFDFSDFGSGLDKLNLIGDASFLQDQTLSPYSDHQRLRLVPAVINKYGKAELVQSVFTKDGFEVNLLWQTTVPNSDSSGADHLIIGLWSEHNSHSFIFDTYNNPSQGSGADPNDVSSAMLKVQSIIGGQNTLHQLIDLTNLNDFQYLNNDLSNQGMVANPYQIRILYEPGKLNIWLDGKVVLANYSINLAGGGISSSTGMSRIYLTSRTGSRFENHDILSWSFNALDTGESPALTMSMDGNWTERPADSNFSYVMERVFHSDPLKPDTDGDGLLDGEEAIGLEYRSNPMLVDTDGDGRSDREEILGVKSYELIDATHTWEQARDFAKLRGGHLATITSQREQDLINPLVLNSNAWLGGSDDNLDGSWKWITGEPWSYQNMGPGQPDNTDGNSTKLNSWSRYPGKWADNRNTNLQSYLLERIIKSDPSRVELESPLLPSDQRLDWTELNPVPIAQFLYDGVDVIDGKIYVAGGSDGGYSDQFSRYDPVTDQWETLPSMSMPRRFMSSAVVDGKFYAMGGKSDASTDLNSTEIFDPVTNSWTPGPYLPRVSWSANAVSLNGKIFLTGGGGSANLDEMLELDPISGQWTARASLQTGRSSHSGVALNGKIYLAGGWESAAGNLATVTVYDPDLDVWTDLPSMNMIRKWPSLFVVGDRLYVAVGVQNGESLRLSSVEVYDPDAKKWVMAGLLPEAKYCAGNAVVNGKVYLFAGRNDAGMSNKMFVGEPNRIILDPEQPTVLPRSASGTYQKISRMEKNASVYSFTALDSDVNDTIHYYLPPAEVSQITIEAENFSWGNIFYSTADATSGYGAGIGVTGATLNSQRNYAVYDLNVSHAGSWKLEIRRAVNLARPCKLFVNGILVFTDGAGGTTGGWHPEYQQWKDEGTFSFRAGMNEIRIERFGYFPHIDKIRLTPQFGVAADQDKFVINSKTGELTLKAVPDFETPQDANGDNVYEVDVVATDGKSSVSQRVMVYVGDIDEPTIVLNGQSVITHKEGMPFNDPGAYWVHPNEGTGSVIPSGEVRVMEVGEYKLTYNHSDSQGNQAVEKIRLVRIENQPPTGISISSDRVEENLPIGARVGVLKTRDPGDPDGRRAYSYQLINIQTGTEQPFSLSSDGTLRTAMVFDFENKDRYSIRVRTTDQFGGSFEKELTIRIVDSFRPIVETRGVVDLNGSGYRFNGELLDKGGISGILEKGFVWAGTPRPILDQNGSFKIVSNGTGSKFNALFKDLIVGKKYFFRAYVRNREGVGYGSVLDLRSALRIFSPWWINAQPGAAANWWTSSWLGSFYMNDTNASWVMHSELGWLYPMESPKSGVWLWKEQLGWLWTDEEFYPFLYQNSSAGWLYFYGASQDRLLFYHYRDERWMQMDSGEQSD